MFHVLMEFAKADVNSPRSVRALSKVRIMKLRELRQTRIHKFSYLSSDSYRCMCVASNTTLGWVKSFCVNPIAKMARIRTKIPRVLPNSMVCRWDYANPHGRHYSLQSRCFCSLSEFP